MTSLARKTDFCDNADAETLAHQQAHPAIGERMREILEMNLKSAFDLPDAAVAWLVGMWDAIQFLDDVADGDTVSRSAQDRAFNQLLVAMPANPFFAANAGALLPVVAVQLLKWQASDMVERAGKADAKSYMWRAGYYDLVLLVIQICHGYEKALLAAPSVMSLYGETLADYLGEFEHA
jgi:hypothetical protein